jgi:hypothetical protein
LIREATEIEVKVKAVAAVAIALLAYRCAQRRVEQVELGTAIRVGTDWLVLKPQDSLLAKYRRSELLLAMPALADDVSARPVTLSDGRTVNLDVVVVTGKGARVQLGHLSVVGYNRTRYVVAVLTPDLAAGDQAGRTIAEVHLRADRAVTLGRVLWLSYDPQDFKGGIAFPE